MTLPAAPPCDPGSPALSGGTGASTDSRPGGNGVGAEPSVDDASTRPGNSRPVPVNRELEGLLAYLEERRTPRPGGRFAVIRWAIRVECYDNRLAAFEALRRLPPSRQLGLIDRKTGETWAPGRAGYQVIKEALGSLLLKPLRFMGVI